MWLRSAVFLSVLAFSAYSAEVTIEQGSLSIGKTAEVPVKLSAAKDALTGLQFDLEYDTSLLDISVQTGPVAQQAGKSVRSAKLAGDKQRVLIIGFNKNAISDGVVAILQVSYKGQSTGQNLPIRIQAASGTNEKAESISATGKDGGVSIVK